LPAGHPEGYLAGYVNIYLNFLNSIKTSNSDKESMEKAFDFPTIQDGIQSVQFITKCVESSNNGSVWVDMD